jgi:hypothetical protein
MHFLDFDGSNPRLWISRSQDYFEMNHVHADQKLVHALLQLCLSRLLHSVEHHLKVVP